MTRVFRLDRRARLEEVRRGAQALGELHPEVLAVVLFGSLARGEATAMSDADLLVLLAHTPWPFGERLVRYRPLGVRGVEVFPYTWEEAEALLAEGLGPIGPALKEGLVLFQREGAWERFRERAPFRPGP
ncbi:nucleotidyltransferase domain-containing protein [Thermus oshimai]|jgi:hypothetical protein|uniref:nucleotidyltransferase domain-containing protein n=1 Tax=Thermus TaxID=270 RepID=UPI0030B03704